MPFNSENVTTHSVPRHNKILRLWDFTLTEIIKHGHNIYHMDHKSALMEIWDKY
jgi:hypothetical protein